MATEKKSRIPSRFGPVQGKRKEKFICDWCDDEVEGIKYEVGFDPQHKDGICYRCFARRRLPPMKPIGKDVVVR